LFEAEAKKLGTAVEVDWRAFASGPQATEALAAGQLDIDLHASVLPIVNRIASGVPASPIGIVGSHLSNAVLVPKNSTIRTVEGLVGKRVGLPIGSSAHYLLASIVKVHFGKSLQEAGIKLINMPAADAMKMPNGIDAAAVWVPLRFIGPQLGLAQMLIDGDGRMGPAAEHPGSQTEEVKRSWAYPEGYNTDRSYAYASDKFISDSPELILAFIRALLEAQRRAVANKPQIVDLMSEKWQQDKSVADVTLQTFAETSGIRKSPFLLEWDILTIVKASEFLRSIGAREKAITMDDLKPLLLRTAEIQKKAWQETAGHDEISAMEAGFSGRTDLYGSIIVNGGSPVWELPTKPDWGQRLYKPGPF
jgi:ABC-type nitrate/sulfonate/bicarbonate transport system substrate-binding protein